MNPILRLAHRIAMAANLRCTPDLYDLAVAAVAEHDRLRSRVHELEKQLQQAKRGNLYPMTDLA